MGINLKGLKYFKEKFQESNDERYVRSFSKSIDPYMRVYGTTQAGENTGYHIEGTGEIGGSGRIVRRTGVDGHLLVPRVPTEAKHATAKIYVDNACDALQARITKLNEQMSILSGATLDFERIDADWIDAYTFYSGTYALILHSVGMRYSETTGFPLKKIEVADAGGNVISSFDFVEKIPDYKLYGDETTYNYVDFDNKVFYENVIGLKLSSEIGEGYGTYATEAFAPCFFINKNVSNVQLKRVIGIYAPTLDEDGNVTAYQSLKRCTNGDSFETGSGARFYETTNYIRIKYAFDTTKDSVSGTDVENYINEKKFLIIAERKNPRTYDLSSYLTDYDSYKFLKLAGDDDCFMNLSNQDCSYCKSIVSFTSVSNNAMRGD